MRRDNQTTEIGGTMKALRVEELLRLEKLWLKPPRTKGLVGLEERQMKPLTMEELLGLQDL